MATEAQQNICKTAGQLFYKFGIRSVSIDDICRQMGISKKTFYVSFDTKDNLVEAVLKEAVKHMSETISTKLGTENLQCWLRSLAEQVKHDDSDVRHVPQLVFDLQKYYPSLFYTYQKDVFELQRKHIAETIRFGQQEGIVRTDINADDSAMFFARLHAEAIRNLEEMEKGGVNMTLYTKNMIKILVRGTLSEKGIQAFESEILQHTEN